MMRLRAGLFIVLFTAAASFLSALPWQPSPMADANGEYVVYRDNTWKDGCAYVGFLYYNDTTYALMLTTPESKTTLLVSVEEKNGTLAISGIRHMEEAAADTYSEQYLLDLFRTFASTRSRINATIFPEPINGSAQIDMLGGLVNIRYQYYIPVFNLESVIVAGKEKKVSLEIVRIGRLVSNDDRSFFDFEPVVWDTAAEDDYTDVHLSSDLTPVPVTSDGITVQLDAQWAAGGNNQYFLNDDKKNAAMITLHGIDGDAAGITGLDDFVRLFTRSTPGLAYDPLATKITLSQQSGTKRLVVENIAIDTVNKIRNLSFAVVTSGTEHNTGLYALVTMSVVAPVYYAQPRYFSALLQ